LGQIQDRETCDWRLRAWLISLQFAGIVQRMGEKTQVSSSESKVEAENAVWVGFRRKALVSRVRSSLLNLLTLEEGNGHPSGAKARELVIAIGAAEAVPSQIQ
jgi:hypothetical protein